MGRVMVVIVYQIVIDTDRWIGLGGRFGAGMNQYRGGSWSLYYQNDRRV
jgi:hypothetical protein